MSAPDDGSYLSRFLLKFVEIIAAGLATALSGYLIAHFSGVLSSPVPTPAAAVTEVAPSMQSRPPARPNSRTSRDVAEPPTAPEESAHGAAGAQPAPPQQEVNTLPDAQPARNGLNATKTPRLRKQSETGPLSAESKRGQDSFLARVRAALGHTDRTDSVDVPPHWRDISNGPTSNGAAAPSPPFDNSPGTVAAAAPASTEFRRPIVQQAPIEPTPLPTVEIKSRPVGGGVPQSGTSEDAGVLTPLEQILRNDPLAGRDDAPRPPMPVGQ
jgi:hypothetical protein